MEILRAWLSVTVYACNFRTHFGSPAHLISLPALSKWVFFMYANSFASRILWQNLAAAMVKSARFIQDWSSSGVENDLQNIMRHGLE